MIKAKVEWRGNLRFVHDILKRAEPAEIEREVLVPWKSWILENRILWMYQAKGAIPSEQPRWAKLSEWTYAMKGNAKGLLMQSARGMGRGSMPRSYVIAWTPTASRGFRIAMVNTARSSSPWSPGFDYPSVLHTGWGPYTVRPRKAGGALRIPFLGSWRANKETGAREFHAGRAVIGKSKKRSQAVYATLDMFRVETHPTGAPARPHIKFYRMDVLELAQRTLDWCMKGRTHGPGERVAA